jgi:hypothetical protein
MSRRAAGLSTCLLALSLVRGSIDLTFLRSGSNRDEVLSRLAVADVRVPEQRFFWGRWRRQWDVYWAAAGGGQTSAVAGGGKATVWRRRNLLVEFDSAGNTSSYEAIGDSSLLSALLSVVRKADQRPQSSVELTFRSAEGEEILFRAGKAEFSGLAEGKPRFTCGIERLISVRVGQESTEDMITLHLEASVPGSTRRKARRVFTLTPREVYELVQFANANQLERILAESTPEEK